ncbi:hypothetical protein Y032_0009g650 [Ancylostoma ceylanicum]|uniref:Uncharacterized protein n=1 Tax=Ancylostoma ceylanicum TaxID=53326 RepID=A0A016VJ46_9BILA|nr:hypothetical protein Y032_0009g650 [Ancylostoma ceylanicum]
MHTTDDLLSNGGKIQPNTIVGVPIEPALRTGESCINKYFVGPSTGTMEDVQMIDVSDSPTRMTTRGQRINYAELIKIKINFTTFSYITRRAEHDGRYRAAKMRAFIPIGPKIIRV